MVPTTSKPAADTTFLRFGDNKSFFCSNRKGGFRSRHHNHPTGRYAEPLWKSTREHYDA